MTKYAISILTAGQPFKGADGIDVEPRGRGQLMQLFKKTGTTAMIVLTTLVVSSILGALVVGHSFAQSDLNIAGLQPKLESKYKEELDKWMLRAYEGDRDAQFKVGVLFTNEQFSDPDFEQAVYWYKQAARQGHVLAQYNLGHQYLSGVSIVKNDTKAMQWWLKAAKQGHALAQFNIGRAYYLGIGLDEDQTQSRDWFERAARNGEPKSIEILEQLGWAKKGQYTDGSAGETYIGEGLQANRPTATETTVAKQPSTTEATESDSSDSSKVETDSSKTADSTKSPIAIYTDPSVRSVLIAIVDSRDELELIKESEVWSTVTSRSGFPVWVHGDFVKASDNNGTISGDSVNARSVPIVTNGTVVGRLNMDEKVEILDKRDEWFRVVAPTRFKAWVKTNDFKAASESSDKTETQDSVDTSDSQTTDMPAQVSQQGLGKNDNTWLFNQPAESYTLQLASFDDAEKVDAFLAGEKFANDPKLHRFTAKVKDIAWTYFLYGQYKDRDKAEVAKQDIKQKKAWIRSFGRLQQNRCVAWKQQLPTPKELNTYCVE